MSWVKALEDDAVDPRHEWTTTRQPVALEPEVVPHTPPRPRQPKPAALCLSHAAMLGDRLGHDAHGLGIPTGVPLGSIYGYAAACVRESLWGKVYVALVAAQMKEKK